MMKSGTGPPPRRDRFRYSVNQVERLFFPDHLVQRIRQESDILALVSSYVSLKKAGQNWVGLCPFHSEKTPSFTVNPNKQFFHCFGCGEGGDAIGFLMKVDGMSFPQALKSLGEKIGISGLAARDRGTQEAERAQEKIYRIQREAADYFHEVLLHQAAGKIARDYLSRRGFSPETWEAFQLGYAPPGWNGLESVLARKGWSQGEMEAAGLIIEKESSKGSTPAADGRRGFYDRFRDRIMFPILDLQRRVVGFGGRVMDSGQPKYLNSPETAVFNKGRHLYALDKARELAGKAGFLVVVEGYFDAIAAHQAGISNVAATLGTALTANHLQQIHRFTPAVKLIFDPDEAGIRAAMRTLDLIIPSPVSGEVVLLPKGEDPDLFIKSRGGEAFRERLQGSIRLLDFAIQQEVGLPAAGTIEGKMKVVDRILPAIRKVTRPVERSYYLKHLAENLGLNEGELAAELSRPAAKRPLDSADAAASGARPAERLPKEEELLIHILIHTPGSVSEVAREIDPDHFSDDRLRTIYSALADRSNQGAVRGASILPPESLEAASASVLTALSVREPEYDDPLRTLKDCVRTLRIKRIHSTMKALESRIRTAEKTGDGSLVKSLQGELMGLKRMTMEVNG